ncbi:MAG: HAD family hydrolase [Lachnospiraceae bacterium]|nr:HAD family hydrolase [Lachnospiraceae bacterium]
MEKEMLSKIKLVCSDVDGTLVDEGKGGLNPEYYSEIKRLKEKGILFAVVSGRSYEAASPLFTPILNDIIFINDNGAVLRKEGKIIKAHSLETELVKEIIRDLKEELKPVTYISSLTGSYAYGPNKEFCRVLREDFHLEVHELENMPESLPEDAGVMSLGFFDPEDAEEAVGKEFIEKWNSHDKIAALAGGKYWFNILQKNIDKGVALKELMEMYGLKDEEVMAIGDNMNDLGMMGAITNSVAIGNARDEVKAVCKYQADTCSNDGVLQILKQL